MASPMQSFIANYLGLAEHRRAEDQLVLSQTLAKAQQLGQAQSMMQLLTDPAARQQLATFFGGTMGPGSQGALDALATGQGATSATQLAEAQARGRGAMGGPEAAAVDRASATVGLTGQAPGQLAQGAAMEQLLTDPSFTPEQRAAFINQFATGQTLGQFAQDQAVAGLDPESHSRAAQMALRLVLTPAEIENFQQGRIGLGIQQQNANTSSQSVANQYELGYANLRQDERQMMNNYAVQFAEMSLRKSISDLEMAARSGSGVKVDPVEAQDKITQLTKMIGTGQYALPDRIRIYANIKQYAQRLYEQGETWAKPMAEMDVEKAAKEAFVPSFLDTNPDS